MGNLAKLQSLSQVWTSTTVKLEELKQQQKTLKQQIKSAEADLQDLEHNLCLFGATPVFLKEYNIKPVTVAVSKFERNLNMLGFGGTVV